jgi:hypothetical protein
MLMATGEPDTAKVVCPVRGAGLQARWDFLPCEVKSTPSPCGCARVHAQPYSMGSSAPG